MISDAALDRAVADAVVTVEQAGRLRAIERELAPEPEPADEESLRFITGFADIFVTIGLVLFLGALAVLMGAGAGSTPMLAGLAACSWLLAEFFTAKRRMALPSIVLLVVFVVAVFWLSAQIAASVLPHSAAIPSVAVSGGPHVEPGFHGTARPAAPGTFLGLDAGWLPIGIAALVAALMAVMHYIHFRVPITIAAGAAALCVLALSAVVGTVSGIGETGLNVTLFVSGLAVFALAMRFDMSDPDRTTRRTDIAFWLHLLAAPLIVHPLIRGLLHGMDTTLTTRAAIGILWVFFVLGALAVIIDRRAILVSGLVYAGIAFGTLVRAYGFAPQHYLVPMVLLTLGAFILLLSAGWQPLRRAILKRLPSRLARRLPHPLVTSQA